MKNEKRISELRRLIAEKEMTLIVLKMERGWIMERNEQRRGTK